MQPDATLDTVGLYCPMPIILTSNKIKELKTGDILEILADDSGIKNDMPVWCKQTGNQLLEIKIEEDIYKVYIKKLAE